MEKINQEIPKTVFDKEYSTQWKREVKFLEDKGINYTYAKRHFKYPVIKFKYEKTPELFLALAEFYNQVRNETFFKNVEELNTEIYGNKTGEPEGWITMSTSTGDEIEIPVHSCEMEEPVVINDVKPEEIAEVLEDVKIEVDEEKVNEILREAE